MWWPDHRSTVARFAGLALALALGSLLAGCFEPLYGEKTLAGGPGLRERLSARRGRSDRGAERHARRRASRSSCRTT